MLDLSGQVDSGIACKVSNHIFYQDRRMRQFNQVSLRERRMYREGVVL